jgi:hypothetical protein
MPHTWVGAEFVCALRNILLYERESDDVLVLAGGVPGAWVRTSPGIQLRGFATAFGDVDYSLSLQGDELLLDLRCQFRRPPTAIILRNPLDRPFRAANGDLKIEALRDEEVRFSPNSGQLRIALDDG